MKVAVVLFNLGGPDKLDSVKPFLFNLFNDKAIIGAPNPIRFLLAKLISSRREKTAQEIYEHLGGKSPILEETEAQRKLLEDLLNGSKTQKSLKKATKFKCFITMRYWHPFAEETVNQVKKFKPQKIILLPLYPQFSTTTSASSFEDWHKHSKKAGLAVNTTEICCYPHHPDFIAAHVTQIKNTLKKLPKKPYRILFSAHGLPQKIIDKGDPYQWQVEYSTAHIVEQLKIKDLDYRICYQSKVGPLKWLEPSTETEIENAAKDKVTLVIVPIAFVSEHSETLVELDIEYRELAEEHGLKNYYRVPTLSANKKFIENLANLCISKLGGKKDFYSERICPNNFCKCFLNGK